MCTHSLLTRILVFATCWHGLQPQRTPSWPNTTDYPTTERLFTVRCQQRIHSKDLVKRSRPSEVIMRLQRYSGATTASTDQGG